MNERIARELERVVQAESARQGRAEEHVLIERPWSDDWRLAAARGEDVLQLRLDIALRFVTRLLGGDPKQREYAARPGPTRLRARFGDSPLGWWQPRALAPTDTERGLPLTEQLDPMEAMWMRTPIGWRWGVYEGYDWMGRPVLFMRLNERAVSFTGNWEDVRVLRPIAWRKHGAPRELQRGMIAGDYPEVTHTPDARGVEALERAIRVPVLGSLAPLDYLRAFHRHGYATFIHGGCVRHAVSEAAGAGDVDLVTTAPVPEIHAILTEVGREHPHSGVSFGLAQWKQGYVRLQRGLDIASLRFRGFASEPRYNGSTGEYVVPAVFQNDLEADAHWKDAVMNALYAQRSEDGAWRIVDPTGLALDDARHHRLRITRHAFARMPTQPLRFWLFRTRGYDSDAMTKRSVRWHAEHLWSRTRTELMARLVWPTAMKWIDKGGFDAFFEDFRRVMIEDGARDLLELFIDTPSLREELDRVHRVLSEGPPEN